MVNEADLDAFARGLHRSYRGFAPRYARLRAEQLAAAGDAEGAEVWVKVAEIIDRQPASDLAA